MEYVVNALTVGVVLGLLVFIHEFGHYAAAKLCGVRVEVFSIGFGKRLLGFKRGETDYRLSVLPLGGYVKMSGENPFEASTGDPGEFMSHPRWQRFIIAIAGPFMNVLLAVAVMTGINMVHFEHLRYFGNKAGGGGIAGAFTAADKNKGEQFEVEGGGLDLGMVAFDNAFLFEFSHPLQRGGGRHAYFFGQFGILQAGVGLEGGENFKIDVIQ